MKLSAKLFLESGEDYIFGPGRLELLRSVAELGSLRQAAQKFGMSYRWAWGRLRDAEKALGAPLLAREESGGMAKTLTAEARELLAWFDQVESDLDGLLGRADARRPAFLNFPAPRAGLKKAGKNKNGRMKLD